MMMRKAKYISNMQKHIVQPANKPYLLTYKY